VINPPIPVISGCETINVVHLPTISNYIILVMTIVIPVHNPIPSSRVDSSAGCSEPPELGAGVATDQECH
jgi:hypothetical protein